MKRDTSFFENDPEHDDRGNGNGSGEPVHPEDLNRHALKAFENMRFMTSPDARPLRILAEYLEPAARLRREKIRDTIVFFGSARIQQKPEAEARLASARERLAEAGDAADESLKVEVRRAERFRRLADYYDEAVEVARRITEWSKGLTGERHFIVCTGGGGGIMQAVNQGAALARGKSVGFNIHLPFEQAANEFITRHLIFNFHYFFMRKFWFVYLAKAIVVFPGGFGTFDELMEVLTLVQTKKPRKTIPIVLYGAEYWNSVINFKALVDWGVVSPEDLDLFKIVDTPDEAFEYVRGRLEQLYLHDPMSLNQVKVT